MGDAGKAVFLSYASQDALAAQRICDALRAAGVEVWFDLNELRGGDAWDQKIRRQIKECTLFVPVISANTNARLEGYFRLEWKLAVDRSHLIADDHAFLVPVVIDGTSQETARVPDKFREVQWTHLVLTETPTAFATRMRQLLRGETPTTSVARGPARAVTRPAHPPWLTALLVLVPTCAGLVFAWRVLPMNRRTFAPPPRPPVVQPPAAAAPLTEARRVMAQAQALYEPWDGATAEDFTTAEQLMKRALDLDPTDGEIWAADAILICGQIVLGHDHSGAAVERARIAAERAVKLAPNSVPAQFAQAFYYRFSAATRDGVEKKLRALVVRAPDDRLLLRILASVLRSQGAFDEAVAVLDRAMALPGGDPVAAHNKYQALTAAGKFAAAEAVVDRELAVHPMPYLYRDKTILLITVHGDLDGAAKILGKIPPAHLLEDIGAYWASQVWAWRRDPDKVILVWHDVTHELIETTDFNGPKAFIVGQAHALAGRQAAAETEWTAALRLVEQQRAAKPNLSNWVCWQARLLAALGRRAEAEEALRTYEQLEGASGLTDKAIPVYLLLGRKAEVLDALERSQARFAAMRLANPEWLAPRLNNFRFNPEWDPLRDEPRFRAMLASMEAAAKK